MGAEERRQIRTETSPTLLRLSDYKSAKTGLPTCLAMGTRMPWAPHGQLLVPPLQPLRHSRDTEHGGYLYHGDSLILNLSLEDFVSFFRQGLAV